MKTAKFFIFFLSSSIIYLFTGCGGASYTEVQEESSEPVTIETFKESLTPDGEWIKITKEEIDPDGIAGLESDYTDEDISVEYIWRPNPSFIWVGWNPYCNGRWVWTDWGWMWASNYNWGWAPYHYGRWWWSGIYGWVWSPGFRWAPAWVTWRFAENHVGWYPISPRWNWSVSMNITNINYNFRNENWTFIERQNFTNVVNNTTIVNSSNNEQIINSSKQVTNLQQKNNKLINAGPSVSNIEKSTGQSINQKTIKETSVKGKPTVGDNSVSVYKGTKKTNAKGKNKGNKGNKGNGNQDKGNFEEKKKP